MKKIIILFATVLIATSADARRNQPRDTPVTIYLHDGTQLEGFVLPFVAEARRIEFRYERGGRIQRIESASIQRIRRYNEEDNSFAEVSWLPRIFISTSGNVRERGPRWLTAVIIGPITLYSLLEGPFTIYFLKREEDVAPVGAIGARAGSERLALPSPIWKFFESYTELLERIRNEEYRATSADIRAVVHQYNFRASQR